MWRTAWLMIRRSSADKSRVSNRRGNHAATKRCQFPLRVERLEDRMLLAIVSTVAAGALVVTSDADGETVTITCVDDDANALTPSRIKVNGADPVLVPGPDPAPVECGSIATISVMGDADADKNVLDLRAVTRLDFTSLIGVTVDGGGGNDVIYGSEFDESLVGGAGNDSVFAGPGDDILQGGLGNDRLSGDSGLENVFLGAFGNDLIDGGEDLDTADFLSSLAGVQVSLPLDSALGQGTDALPAIENVIGSLFSDRLIGDGGANMLSGELGNDTISGGAGNDVLDGGGGNASLDGGLGNDMVLGGAGNDLLLGGAGIDTLDGGDDDDVLRGGDDADVLLGATGNDLLLGDRGNDELNGGAGNDAVRGGRGDDSVTGGDGIDRLFGERGFDVFFIDPLDRIVKQ